MTRNCDKYRIFARLTIQQCLTNLCNSTPVILNEKYYCCDILYFTEFKDIYWTFVLYIFWSDCLSLKCNLYTYWKIGTIVSDNDNDDGGGGGGDNDGGDGGVDDGDGDYDDDVDWVEW